MFATPNSCYSTITGPLALYIESNKREDYYQTCFMHLRQSITRSHATWHPRLPDYPTTHSISQYDDHKYELNKCLTDTLNSVY